MTKFMITNRADTKKDVSLLNIFPNPLEVCKTGIQEYFQVLSWIDITQICPLYVFCVIFNYLMYPGFLARVWNVGIQNVLHWAFENN